MRLLCWNGSWSCVAVHSKWILIIDDEQAIAGALRIRLSAVGYEVILASDGRSGLVEAENHRPDAILLDIRMPDMDGYEVCRHLKANPELASIPVIFVSANATETTRQKAYEVGGSVFISKPYEPKDIMDAIESVVSRAA